MLNQFYHTLSFRNESRSEEFAIFRLTIRSLSSEIAELCFASSDELDLAYEDAKRFHYFVDPEYLSSLPNLTSEECHSLLQATLLDCKQNVEKLVEIYSLAANFSASLRAKADQIEIEAIASEKLAEVTQKTQRDDNETVQQKLDVKVENLEYRLYKFAFEQIGEYWKELGACLGFSKMELDDIDQTNHTLDVKYKAWCMIYKYYQREGNTTIESMTKLLEETKARRKLDVTEVSRKVLPPFVIDHPLLRGREQEMRQIENFFWDDHPSSARVSAICERKILILRGVGGVGKTSLAYSFAFRYADAYVREIHHFNAESFACMEASLRDNMRRAGEKEFVNFEKSSQRISLYFSLLQSIGRVLVLIYGADEYDLVKDYLPGPTAPCHVLITTRSPLEELEDHDQVKCLSLEPLDGENAVTALRSWAGFGRRPVDDSIDSEYARRLALEPPIEGLPIAIAHAGTFIKRHRLSFQRYWEKLRAATSVLDAAALDLDKFLQYFRLSHLKRCFLQAGVTRPGQLSVAALSDFPGLNDVDRQSVSRALTKLQKRTYAFLTWELDLDDVECYSKDGYAILSVCSVLNGQEIPQDIVANAILPADVEFGDFRIAAGIRALCEHSLISQSVGNDFVVRYSVHSLIQGSVVERLKDNSKLKEVITSAECSLFTQLPSPRLLPLRLADDSVSSLCPHAYAVAGHMLSVGMLGAGRITMIDYGVTMATLYHDFNATIGLRKIYAEKLKGDSLLPLSVRETKLSDNYFSLATAYGNVGASKECERYLILALRGRSLKELLDERDMTREWRIAVRLAEVYRSQGRSQEALGIISQVISSFSDVTEIPGDFSNVYQIQARAFEDQSEHGKQLESLKRGLTLHESVSCSDYKYTLLLIEIGDCFINYHNKASEALPFFVKSLKLRQRLFPRGHLSIALALRRLSYCYMELGQWKEGLKNSTLSLSMAKECCTPDHPELPAYFYCHGYCLVTMKKAEEALPYFQKGLALIKSNPYSCDRSSELAHCLFGLGDALISAKRLDGAIPYYEESVAVCRNASNIHTSMRAKCLNGLALAYFYTGRFTEAVPCLREQVEMLWKSPHPDYSLIADRVKGLCGCLMKAKKLGEAQRFLVKSIRDLSHKSRLPPTHPQLRKLEDLLSRCQIELEKDPTCRLFFSLN
ncbi:uncharacterized protein [Oscarella lobularis]|uniref:uncharacterized protein isoform X2 n=1 Tax=Oscarella lobularis TaxID=121494 RepID=UPI003313AA9B